MSTIKTSALPKHLKHLANRKRMVHIHLIPAKGVQAWDTQWSGGSRTEYFNVCLATGEAQNTGASDGLQLTPTWAGWCVVSQSFYCGKQTPTTFWLRPEDLLAILGIKLPLPFGADLGPAADWCEENGRSTDAALIREVLTAR